MFLALPSSGFPSVHLKTESPNPGRQKRKTTKLIMTKLQAFSYYSYSEFVNAGLQFHPISEDFHGLCRLCMPFLVTYNIDKNTYLHMHSLCMTLQIKKPEKRRQLERQLWRTMRKSSCSHISACAETKPPPLLCLACPAAVALLLFVPFLLCC